MNFSASSLWSQSDAVSLTVAALLALLSILSWGVILSKGWRLWQMRQLGPAAIDHFWQSADLASGIDELARQPTLSPFAELARRGTQAVQHFASHAQQPAAHLDARQPLADLVTRALRQGINRALAALDAGQTLLASIGSTAPFIGLFGTVWGIVHALGALAGGQGGIEQVAGPVGEALIMTAAGLFVAIPAVLAYNAFNRHQRLIAADLDAFAHELHTFLTTGHPLASGQPQAARAVIAEAV